MVALLEDQLLTADVGLDTAQVEVVRERMHVRQVLELVTLVSEEEK